jgi:hypothetical protein
MSRFTPPIMGAPISLKGGYALVPFGVSNAHFAKLILLPSSTPHHPRCPDGFPGAATYRIPFTSSWYS